MADKIHCATHGESEPTYVCIHLLGDSVGLGFNRNEPTSDNRYPEAWCDDCELIREAYGGWSEQSERLTKISLLCSGCYSRARIRNSHTSTTLDDLDNLRWKCGTCEEWHTGPCLDFGYDWPRYWTKKHEEASRDASHLSHPATFLNEDYCAIEDRDFFVRGIINLPIIGTAESLCWGVWGSLGRENFEKLLHMQDDPKRVELPPMFSWMSTRIPEYPETLNLKLYCHVQEVGRRPFFEVEATDHPLAQEYHNGITPERVKEIMLGRLGTVRT